MTRKRPDRLPLLERALTGEIIGAFYSCYNELGFGFLESVYRRALAMELRLRGIVVAEERTVEVSYRGVSVGMFRMDLVVAGRVIIEVKSASVLGPTDKRQLLNYLRATPIEVGMLLHFGPEPKFYRFADHKSRQAMAAERSPADPAVSASSV